MTGLVAEIFGVIGDAVTSFVSILTSGISSLVSVFYTTGTNGGFTFLGTLAILGVGAGLVIFQLRQLNRISPSASLRELCLISSEAYGAYEAYRCGVFS